MRSAFREIIETLIVSILLFFVLQMAVQNFQVEGPSMQPTIHSGQLLLVNKAVYMHASEDSLVAALPLGGTRETSQFYLFHPPQRGDIIVFWDDQSQQHLIKRIIGAPGDVVELRRGRTFLNGQELEEPYLVERSRDSMAPLRLGAGEYFVMGDNRPASCDSRTQRADGSHLTVRLEDIVGKAWVSFWPPEDLGFLPHYPLLAQPD